MQLTNVMPNGSCIESMYDLDSRRWPSHPNPHRRAMSPQAEMHGQRIPSS
jgi:hypothetical protein